MKLTSIFLFLILFLGCKKENNNEEKVNHQISFYVGTYTNNVSKGIYKYKISKKGMFIRVGLVAVTNNPSFLAKTKDNKTLLAVDETNIEGSGFVKSFAIHKDTLKLISTSKSGGAHPCFITVNNKNQVLVANYSGGNVGFLTLDKKSKLSNLLYIQQHKGKGTTNRQKAPYAHSTWFHPNKEDIISVDLGTNELWFSKINEEKKELFFLDQKKMKFEDGAGPRHLAFHPNKNFIYVLNELNNTVSVVKEKEGYYFVDTSFSMLPKNFSKFSKGADIHISNDGKFLYASNRGHNSIVIYKVNQNNGGLDLVGFESVKVVNPRNFSLTPNNNYLVVANQDSNNIISFKRDSDTGLLEFVDEISAPNPVCILF